MGCWISQRQRRRALRRSEVYASILKATGGVAEPRLALDPARYSTAEGSCGQLFGVLLVAIVTRGAIEGASGAIKGKRG